VCTIQGLCHCDNLWAGLGCETRLEDKGVQLEDGGMSAGTYGGLLFLVCFVSLLLLAIALMPPKWRDALWGYLLQPCKATATMTDLRARVAMICVYLPSLSSLSLSCASAGPSGAD